MLGKVIGVTLLIVAGIALVCAFMALCVCGGRMIRNGFRYTKLYEYMVNHGAFSFSVEDRKRWEKIQEDKLRLKAKKQEGQEVISWRGKEWYIIPDYIGEAAGYIVNKKDYEAFQRHKLKETEVETYVIKEEGVTCYM